MLFLTLEQHQHVLESLLHLGKKRTEGIPSHSEGFEYTSLMVCFLLHNLSSAETLLKLSRSFGNDWFPVAVGYITTRSMFETDVTAHYITKKPKERAKQYIDFGQVLKKRRMDACAKHRNSSDSTWREAMSLIWENHWKSQEDSINRKYKDVLSRFTHRKRKKKQNFFQNWSGKSIRTMAEEVDHTEAYDIFYADLSSFAHIDVRLADRFLQTRPDGFVWSQHAEEVDVANVFRYAAFFLTCYMNLFGRQFRTWSENDVESCWAMYETELRNRKK